MLAGPLPAAFVAYTITEYVVLEDNPPTSVSTSSPMNTFSVILLFERKPFEPLITKLAESIGEVPMVERRACNLRESLVAEVELTLTGTPGTTEHVHNKRGMRVWIVTRFSHTYQLFVLPQSECLAS